MALHVHSVLFCLQDAYVADAGGNTTIAADADAVVDQEQQVGSEICFHA